MIEVTNNNIKVSVSAVFDLGLEVLSEDGNVYQLRCTEMDAEFAEYDREGKSEDLVGRVIEVFKCVTFSGRVSQLSQKEINFKKRKYGQ